eukprot:291392-Pelagomonas_calceolata.AAC.4
MEPASRGTVSLFSSAYRMKHSQGSVMDGTLQVAPAQPPKLEEPVIESKPEDADPEVRLQTREHLTQIMLYWRSLLFVMAFRTAMLCAMQPQRTLTIAWQPHLCFVLCAALCRSNQTRSTNCIQILYKYVLRCAGAAHERGAKEAQLGSEKGFAGIGSSVGPRVNLGWSQKLSRSSEPSGALELNEP